MRVVRITQRQSKEVVAVLEELLELARAGDVHGVAFVVKRGPRDHWAGAAGDYRRFPEEALSATFLMERALMSGRPPYDSK